MYYAQKQTGCYLNQLRIAGKFKKKITKNNKIQNCSVKEIG